jgi:hypothetical protein
MQSDFNARCANLGDQSEEELFTRKGLFESSPDPREYWTNAIATEE